MQCWIVGNIEVKSTKVKDVKASGFDPMTEGSAVRIPAVVELSFGIKLTF